MSGTCFQPVPGYPNYVAYKNGTIVSLDYHHTGKPKALKPKRGDAYGHFLV